MELLVPGGHGMHASLLSAPKTSENVLGGQPLQFCDPSPSWKVPCLQDLQDLPPDELNVPLGHGVHAEMFIAPLTELNVPGGQSLHLTAPSRSWNSPVIHAVHLDDPTLENDPRGQVIHALPFVEPTSSFAVPAGQGLHSRAPMTSENVPEKHWRHWLLPARLVVPLGQSSHISRLVNP
eukprot:GFKZ01016153.1.p2 GENE.GFKZ01016153.1~~GFKZ01016153.1.p2  ORF type:complete len:179 (+),score=1.46 GFKZ01016153.1:222-758(+)